ncbi:hypothetical protein RP20_CCG024858 [Aedes albopictus]|nr:hypothetical protein RP20_CCG024858 [Aedes albopictus]
MDKNCAKCNQTITGLDFVTCRGYCHCTFHMQCSGVSRALMNYFTSHRKNVYWMCDKCGDLFENSHLRSITKVADENSPFASLTEAISNLQKEIKQLSKPAPPTLSPAVRLWPQIESARAPKRLRGPDLTHMATECRSGSKQVGQNVVSVPITAKPENKFWLYLSRIRPDVTNEQISEMVKANLELDEAPNVVKLVAKDADVSRMNFISFKVGLDPVLKTRALDPSTWPEGLMFREFEEYSAQKFRKPSVVNLTPTSAKTPEMSMQ